MPPAKRSAIDDRSDTSSLVNGQKDRANTGAGISKSKKTGTSATNDSNSTLKTAAINGALTATEAKVGAGDSETPQTDWMSVSVPVLHTYRAAYKISTPASYTRPHADLIYNSSDIARQSPSQVLARRKSRDLKHHRRKLAQTNNHNTKSTKNKLRDRDKDKDAASETSRDGRRRQNGINYNTALNGDSIAQSIEPNSPTVASAATSESAPSTLLNSSNPEATIIGRQSPISLATNIRKHFNAQPLHEHDTIARFTYVMRQQGYGSAILPTSTSTGGTGTAVTTAPRTAQPIRVEGSDGDGSGWIMGSMGRQTRMSDTGGGGAFRLRFRP